MMFNRDLYLKKLISAGSNDMIKVTLYEITPNRVAQQ